MAIFSFGPQPEQKVIEDRPDGVSVEAAFHAWQADYADARAGRDYHVFPEDSADLQPLYSDSFERGERDKLHMTRIAERVPAKPEEQEQSPPVQRSSPLWRSLASWLRLRALRRQVKVNIEVLLFLAALGLIAAVVWR